MHYFIIVDRSCTLTVRHGHIYVEKKTVLIVSLLNTTHPPIINTHTHTYVSIKRRGRKNPRILLTQIVINSKRKEKYNKLSPFYLTVIVTAGNFES